MAITRRQRHQYVTEHSRRLRSGAVLLTQPAERAAQPPHQKSRQRAGRFSLPAHAAHVDHGVGRIWAPMVDLPGGSNLDSHALLTGCDEGPGSRTGGEEASPDLGHEEGGSPQPLSPPPDLMHSGALEMAGTKTGSLVDAIPHDTTSQLATIPNVEKVVQNFDDVGVPRDGSWNYTAAHESRFCVQHEEEEWLLRSVDRWMFPSDFNISGAETALEAKLQRYQSRQWSEKTHRRASRADCDGDLGSHVDTPIQRGEFEGKVIYLIRWKLCWTRRSDIDDMSWVRSSFQARNERINRRRSARVEKTAPERMAKIRAMMVVVHIENLL